MKYKTKPFEVEAMQWTGRNFDEVYFFTDSQFSFESGVAKVYDYLQDTWVVANINDFIIRGSRREYYPCAPDVFNAKYEPTGSVITTTTITTPHASQQKGFGHG